MCTVSLIRPLLPVSRDWGGPDPLLMRLVVNRDERRDRSAALPPMVVESAASRALMPVDPQGGGTWVAATDAGLVFAILNGPDRDPGPATADLPPSRGSIIPRLLDCATVDEALDRVRAMDFTRFRPWRLIVADGARFVDVERRPNGTVRHVKSLLPIRFMATSSSIRHAEALRRRTDLFRSIVAPVDERRQDAFHEQRVAEDPAIGVVMERAEARTVSHTWVEMGAGRVVMRYLPVVAGAVAPQAWTMSLARGGWRRGAA